jgi:hypothetical protein
VDFDNDDGADHLAELCMAGTAARSGRYTPQRATLSHATGDQAGDLVVYLHEVHHAALNDSTAWGVALHVYAALDALQRDCFRPLLDACRVPHEAYATFAAVNVASAHHPAAADVLAHYPAYIAVFGALDRVLGGVPGPHRKYLAATALARVSMQTPILSAMLEAPELIVEVSDLRRLDTPNGRWRWLLAQDGLIDDAAVDADRVVRERHGEHCLDVDDGTDVEAASADELDPVWALWETTVYERLACAIDSAGARILAFNGHMDLTGLVLERARRLAPEMSLRAARIESPAPDDRALSAATIAHMRLDLPSGRRAGALRDRSTEEPVETIDADQRIDGAPTLVVSARLPRRLLDSYRWDPADEHRLAACTAPVVVAPVIAVGEAESTIEQTILETPDALAELTERWAQRGPVIVIAAASCFVDRDWAGQWSAALRPAGMLVVLIDVEAERFVNSWVQSGIVVRSAMVRVADTSGIVWALALQVGEYPSLWLHINDEVSVKLLRDQLRHTHGLAIEEREDHLDGRQAELTAAITHLLATESFFDLQGLDDATIRRVASQGHDG